MTPPPLGGVLYLLLFRASERTGSVRHKSTRVKLLYSVDNQRVEY